MELVLLLYHTFPEKATFPEKNCIFTRKQPIRFLRDAAIHAIIF